MSLTWLTRQRDVRRRSNEAQCGVLNQNWVEHITSLNIKRKHYKQLHKVLLNIFSRYIAALTKRRNNKSIFSVHYVKLIMICGISLTNYWFKNNVSDHLIIYNSFSTFRSCMFCLVCRKNNVVCSWLKLNMGELLPANV